MTENKYVSGSILVYETEERPNGMFLVGFFIWTTGDDPYLEYEWGKLWNKDIFPDAKQVYDSPFHVLTGITRKKEK